MHREPSVRKYSPHTRNYSPLPLEQGPSTTHVNFGKTKEAVCVRPLRLLERYHALCAHLAQQILPPHASGSTLPPKGAQTKGPPHGIVLALVQTLVHTNMSMATPREAHLEVAHPTPRVGLDINAHDHPPEA